MLSLLDADLFSTGADYIVVNVPVGWHADPVEGLDREVAARWPDARDGLYAFVRQRRFGGGDICPVAPTESRPGIVYLAASPAPGRMTMAFVSRGVRNIVAWGRREKIRSVAFPFLLVDASDRARDRIRELYEQELSRVKTEYFLAAGTMAE